MIGQQLKKSRSMVRYLGLGLILMLSILLVVALCWGLQQGARVQAQSATLYVDGTGGGDTGNDCLDPGAPCATLGRAISQAGEGDTVLIGAGTYTENLVISNITLTLRGGYEPQGTLWLPGGGETVVNGNGADRVFLVHGNRSVLENLTITGGDTPDGQCWGGGLWVTDGDVAVRSSRIEGNWADCSGGGIEVNSDWGPAHLTLENSIVADNHSGDWAGGVSVWHAAAHVTNTQLTYNSANATGSALRIEDSDVTIQNGTIVDNQGGSAIDAYDTDGLPDELVVRNTVVWGNSDANVSCDLDVCEVTYSDVGGGWPGAGNIDGNPRFVDPQNGDYHLQAWSPCIDTGTPAGAPDHDFEGDPRPQNGGFDIGADEFVGTPVQNAGTRYVATGGSDGGPNLCTDPGAPCQTIGQALQWANGGEEVWVAGGIYTENLQVAVPVSIMGGFESATWSRDIGGNETVVDGSGRQTVLGDWDGVSVGKPAVISDAVEYKMWFDGVNLLGEVQIGLATSDDGINWTKQPGNPVLTGTWGTWNEPQGEHAPFVIEEGGVYKMWYEGTDGNMVRQLGYATSTNGIDWQPYAGNPVLSAGPEGYDQAAAAHGSLLHEGGTYHLWYHADGDQGPGIAYATSADGVNWTKQAMVLAADPAGWDDIAVWGPSVLKLGSTYWMWHAGSGSQGPPAIGVVTSTDGLSWTRFLTAPVLTVPTPIGDPHVISDGGKLRMWFQDFETNGIYYAESNDGLAWSQPSGGAVLTPGVAGEWAGPVVQFESGSDGAVLDGLTITGGSGRFAGGVHADGYDVTIRASLIRDNFAHGGPSSQGAAGVLGGLGGGRLTVVDSRVVNNRANDGAGGIRVHQGTLVITNTVIADNLGAPAVHVNGTLALMNVTVANNDGGILFNPPPSATLAVANSIVYGNGWAAHDTWGTGQIIYSDIEGGWSGSGNIDADPQFWDPLIGDYHLQGSSPAIDAGTPAGAPPVDLDGAARDVPPDMGAYEYARFDHDVAVVDVLPGSAVAVNVPFPIRATLYNVGKLAESGVPVTCEIEEGGSTVYQQTADSGQLQPLAWEVIVFPNYTPTALGDYLLVCESGLVGDERPANDAYTRTLTVLGGIADVWTKDNPQDDGEVPSGLDSWYESPDLWVRNEADGGLVHQDPIAGITNTVYVQLRNRGTLPISGTVDVSWIEPSLGVRCGDWAPIGTIPFTSLLPGEVRIVSVPWIPTRTGHTCLQDVIDSPQDPYNRALECAPQWVPWDNNVEWHNVNIIANPAQMAQGVADVHQAQVHLVNLYNLQKDVDVIVERMSFPAAGTITVKLPPGLFDRWQANGGRWSEGIEVLTSTREIRVTGQISGTIGGLPLAAAEKAVVDLAFDGPAGLSFDMGIRERIDGLTTGGVVYQWTIPDTTPPTVTETSPAAGATKVALDAPLVISFNEAVGPLSLDLALTPDPGGWRVAWNETSTVVTATHAGFAEETAYAAAVTARDGSGNEMAAPLHWSFTTLATAYEIHLPLVLK